MKKERAKTKKACPCGFGNDGGFVILYAILLSTMLLSITLGVVNIALREVQFSTGAKDTNNAFLATDTGVECALSNDKATSTSFLSSGGSGTVNCLGNIIPLVGSYPIWSFTLSGLGSDGAGCAKVTVDKSVLPNTTITSKGYNSGDALCDSSAVNRLEREFRVVYGGATPPPANGIDLIPDYLAWVPDPVSQGDGAAVTFRVKNNGDVASGAFDIQLKQDGVQFCSWTVSGLAPSATFEQSGSGGCEGFYGIKNAQQGDIIEFVVDTANDVVEANEANNTMTRTVSVYGPPALTANPSLVNPGDTVTVTFSDVIPSTPLDWIGVYLASETYGGGWEDWVYTSGSPSCSRTPGSSGLSYGSCTFTMNGTFGVPGTYNFRLLLNDSSTTVVATSNTVTVVSGAGSVPTVTLPSSSLVMDTSATLGANVTSLGNPASISARGTCWGTSANPTTNCSSEGGTTTGPFTHSRTGLPSGTLIYYRGYATNATGTGYSEDGTFTTDTGPYFVFGNSSVAPNTDNNNSNLLNAVRFTMPAQGGTAVSMSVYVTSPIGASPNNQYQMAIYSDSSGNPGDLVANTATDILTGNAWNTLPISTTLSANTTYWLVYNSNGASSAVNNLKYDAGGVGQYKWKTQTFGTFPPSFGATIGQADFNISIYVNYTSSPASPDLVAGTTSPTTATAGTALTFSGAISNLGSVSTGAGFNNFFQLNNGSGGSGGANSQISVNAMTALGASPATALATSSSFTFSSSGTYSVRLCADTDAVFSGTISESNEGNNCGVWTDVLVSPADSVPTVTLPSSSLVMDTSATLGANVTSLGNPASISARGTCWGTSANPTTNCSSEGGTTTGPFTHSRTGLPSGTLIYYRGYATNATGTGYSEDGTFTTTSPNLPPIANAGADQNITLPTNSATLNGSGSSDSDGTISSYVWDFVSGPSTVNPADTMSTNATPLVAGAYVFRLTVTDNLGATATDTVSVTVNSAPTSYISLVGAVSVAGATISIPAHQAGDLILVFAYRDGNTTAPSLPGGWTNIGTAGGANTNSSRLAYKVATGAGTPSGTWSNATELVAHVYRGQSSSTPIGSNGDTGAASSATVTYPGITLSNTSGTSWVAGFAGHRSVDTNIQNAPSSMINRTSKIGTGEVSGNDTNGGVSSWSNTSVAVGGTASGWRARTVEIISSSTPPSPTNYTLTASTTGSGAVSLSPSGGVYSSGTVVTLTANPSSGWLFSGWSGDLSGSANPTNITMNADKTVTATFVQMSGTLTPASSSCTVAIGGSSCVTQTLTWTTTNPIGTSEVTSPTGTPSPAVGNNGAQTFTAPYNAGGVNFYLYNNALLLAQATVVTSCASGSTWNGSVCAMAPTFTLGNSSVGASTDNSNSNYMNATRFTMPAQGGTVVSMSIYIPSPIGASPNDQYQLAIYSDSAGSPGTLVTSSAIGTLTGDTWNTLPVSGTLNANTSYWLVYNTNGASTTVNNIKYDQGSSGQFKWKSQTFGTFPSSFGATSGPSSMNVSIYATYTAN